MVCVVPPHTGRHHRRLALHTDAPRPAPPRPASPCPTPPPQAISFLLSRNYLLTALELLHEAGEAGLEGEVARLLEFFRDAALFPPEAVAACNPAGGACCALEYWEGVYG